MVIPQFSPFLNRLLFFTKNFTKILNKRILINSNLRSKYHVVNYVEFLRIALSVKDSLLLSLLSLRWKNHVAVAMSFVDVQGKAPLAVT